MFRLFKVFFLGMVIMGSLTYAFAAPSSQADSAAGEGATSVSGWIVSALRYQLAKDPAYISGVEFDLNSQAETVKIKLVSTDSQYYSCISPRGTHWICDTPGLTAAAIDELRVIALNH